MTDDITSRLRKDPGNKELWSLWYEKMYPRIALHSKYYMLQRSIGATYSVQDAVHDALVKFVESFIDDVDLKRLRKKIKSDDDAIRHLRYSVRDTLLNELRRENRRDSLLKTYAADVPHNHDGVDGRTKLSTLEKIDDFRNALKLLDETEKKVLLATLNGDTLEEISKKVGKSYNNVGVMRHRMLKKLRTHAEK